jgi:glycogen operon protein
MNATAEDREFTLPQPALPWRLIIDSAEPETLERPVDTASVVVGSRAATILVAACGTQA